MFKRRVGSISSLPAFLFGSEFTILRERRPGSVSPLTVATCCHRLPSLETTTRMR